jgi:hypothetical protein
MVTFELVAREVATIAVRELCHATAKRKEEEAAVALEQAKRVADNASEEDRVVRRRQCRWLGESWMRRMRWRMRRRWTTQCTMSYPALRGGSFGKRRGGSAGLR